MPMKPITVKANFQLDTSAARAQLQGLQRELNSVTKGATMDLGISSQITQAIKEAQQLKQILAEATDFSTGAFDLSKFDAAIKQQGKSIAEFKQSLQALGPEGEKAFNSLATTIASAQVPLKRTSQGIQQMMTAFGNTMRWQATSMAMHKIVGTFQQAFNYAQNLDKSLTNIQIVTGHNADYMRNFAREANKAAQALSASTLEYTNASLIYYQQGLSDKEVQKRAETTLKLAKVTGESASKVSQQMTAVWNNFSNGVDNLERYADVMTALGATTASSSSEIAKGLEKFASVTKTIGLSYDYAASALATVTAQTRQSADSVGTAFKTLFSRLESLNLGETLDDNVTLNKYSEALLKVGVNVMDASGKLKNMDTILDELGNHWNNLNKAQQVALAQTVGGVRNYTSLITLMDNWDKFQTNVVTSQLAEGTLQKQADIYAQSWEAAQQRVKTASQGIYDTLISSDFFKGFNNALAGTLNTINKVGQTLGTSGSVAGVMNLVLGTNRDRIAQGIDNTIVNTLGQTSLGKAMYQKQQQNLLEDFTQGIFDTGTASARQRQGAFQALTNQWKDFNSKEYKTKQEAALNQAIMQQRTSQVQSFMNSTIDTEQLSLKNNLSQRSLSEKLAGTYGLGKFNAKTVQEQLLNPFLGGGQGGIGNFRMGASGYINTTFMNQLDKLAAMDLTAGPGSRAEALAKQLQAQAANAFKSNQIVDLLGSNTDLREGMEKLMTLPLEQLMKPENISAIQESFSKFNVAQLQAYQNARQKLDQAFLSENEDAVLKDKEGNAILDKNGKKQIDTSSEKGKSYLASMKDAEITAEQYLQKGLIDEQTYQDIKSGNKNLQDIVKAMDRNTTSFGQAAVSTGQMISSMAMAASSLTNFHQQVKDGTATATSLFTTMGSTGMALGQVASVLGNKDLIDGLGMSVRSLGMIAGGAAVVGVGALYAYKAIQARNLEAKQEYTNENRIALSAAAKENQQKYEQFLPIIQQYQNTIDKLTNLQQGTSTYTASLIAANNQAREIIEAYELEAGKDYTYKNGQYSFSAEQIRNTEQQLLENSKRSSTYAQLGISANTQIKSLQEERRLNRIQDAASINPQNYDETYNGYIDTTWGYDQFQQDLQKIEDAHEIVNTKAYQEALRDNEQRALAQKADFQVALETVISNYDSVSEAERMAVTYLGESELELQQYAEVINEKVGPGGVTRNWLGQLRSEEDLRAAYIEEFGIAASANATVQDIAAELDARAIYNYLDQRIAEYSSGENALNSTYFTDFANINDKNFSDIKLAINKIESDTTLSKEDREVYNTFIQKALTDSIKAQDNLVQTMLNNSQFERQDFLKVVSELQTEANLSTTQLENVTNYLNSFTNNFGETAGKAVFDALTNEGKGWNQNYYEALQKISLDNSISALADLTHFTDLGVNADLAEPLTNLRKAILEDIDDRGGLAKTLFTSSDFTKVFDTLSEQYKSTGEITAQNIADLAKKNEIIGDYMTVTGSNEQAIADMMEMISSGNITAEGITPAIEHFVQRATGAAGAQQEALDVVTEQDLSDSITNMDKWAQNIGKAFYVGRTNDVLGDRPVLEGLKMVLTPEDYAEYLRILNTGAYGGTTSSMLSDMKGSMANAYAMLDELEGSKKKKGKGGGGMDTVYKYLAKEGIFDESGIGFDESSGRFTLGKDFGTTFGENKLVTFNSLKDYIIESLIGSEVFGGTYNFQGKGYNRSQAEDMATMMLGSMSASSMGTVLSQSGLIDAAQTFFGEISANGQKQGNYITNEQYDALFNQYADVLALMKMEETTDENGQTTYKLREATKEELANKDYGVSIDQWRDYFTQEAKKVGAAIIGIKGQNLTNKDAKAIGTELAKASQGTLTANKEQETKAIVDAAVAAGVQTYRDTWTIYENGPRQARSKIEMEGQSLDYDQLQEFYNNVLGLSTETLNSHLKEISEQNGGLAFTHKYTDAYGVEHNINSRDYADTGAFTRAIEQENDFSNIVLQYQRDQWVQQYFNDETINKGKPSYEGAMEYLREMTRQETEKAQKEASTGTQSEPTTPPEGEKETPPEGETPTPTIDDLKRQRQVSAKNGHWDEVREFDKQIAELEGQQGTGATAWDKASDAEKAGFIYSSRTDAADIYNYWKQHPGMTQAEAYDDVVILGKKPEPPKGTAAPTPSENLPGSGPLEGEGPTAAEAAEAAERQRWDDAARAAMEREEKEAQALAEKQAAKRNAKIAASIVEVGVGSEEYDRASFTAQMSPSEYKAYSDWVKSGGSGEPADWAQEKETQAKTEEETTTIEPVPEDYESPDTPSATWDILPTADKNKEVAADLGYKQNLVTPAGSPYSEAEITKQQEEATQRTIDLLMQNGYSETLARQIMNGEISPEEAQVAKEEEALQAEEEANMVADAIGEATETAAIETAETQNTLAENINENLSAMGEAIPGTEEYDKAFASANQYTPTDTAAEKTNDLLADSLRQEKFIAENTQITAESTTAQLDYMGEEEEAAQIRKAIGQEEEVTEEEQDELNMPTNQSSGGGGGRRQDSGDTGGGGRGGGGGNASARDMVDNFNYINNGGSLFDGTIDWDGMNDAQQSAVLNAKQEYDKEHMSAGDYYNAYMTAKGQNNARLLAYASGKEGHIAITGELGPELRIKSDGSMDVLGKTGREYVWIEPEDRVYTAAQSAGILKSNKIPGLEGLAKGINNFLPGYYTGGDAMSNPISSDQGGSSSSGSGGSGSSRGSSGATEEKDPRYDPNTLKIRDILERYYTILQQLDDITKAVEHMSKVVDRGWGQERIKALDRQEKLLEQQYKLQQEQVKEIKDYLKVDKDALTNMVTDFVKEYNEGKEDKDKISLAGATFDENGVITNYKEIIEKLVAKYNENAEANSQNKEEQYKFQERLKDIQMYTDTLNQLQEAEEKLYDLNNQILDTKIRKITYEVEYKNEMDQNELRLINFMYDQIADNAYRTAEAIDLTAQKSSYLVKELNRYGDSIIKILGQYFDRDLTDKLTKMFYENPTAFAKEWQKIMETDPRYQDMTEEHKNTIEGWMDRSVDIVKTLWDNYDKTVNKMADDIKTFGKTLDGVISKFDYFDTVYKSLNNIIGLTNRSLTNIDSTFMKTLSNKQLENNMNNFKAAARNAETMNKALAEATLVYDQALAQQNAYLGDDQYTKDRLQDEVDAAKKALDTVVEQNENATKDFYDAWEDCLKAIEEVYKVTMQEAGRDFEKSISPYFMTLELLQNQYDREKELGDLYVKDYQRIHDLSKLNRDIQKSIDDTDNLKGKQRLRDLQQEINDLQENGNDLSEYDLDILDKKYKLELARQALEDARDAKSIVRLSRDNNGNWGYVYTADEDEIADAEQNYEDAIRDMEQANDDYINNMQDQIVALTAQARQALEGLNPADFASIEDFENYVNHLIKFYQDQLDFATSQTNNAIGNNVIIAPDIQRMYDNLDHKNITDFGQTRLSALFGNSDLGSIADNIMNSIGNMGNEALNAYVKIYSEMQKEVYNIAGIDIADAASSLGDLIKIIAKASDTQVAIIDQEADRIDEAYANTIDSILAYQTTLDDLIGTTKTTINTLSSLNTFLLSSGEYVPVNTLYNTFATAYKDIVSGNVGSYTGAVNRSNGQNNDFLDNKILDLNAHDAKQLLDTMDIVKQLDFLAMMKASGLGDLTIPKVTDTQGELEQNVHIDASFPNVQNHNEIEEAFTNLVNMASQYAYRKA